MYYPCPNCKHPCLTPQEAAKHCDNYTHNNWNDKGRTCDKCGGSGKVYYGFTGEIPCDKCGGRGTY